MKFLEKLIKKLAGVEPSARGQPMKKLKYPLPSDAAENPDGGLGGTTERLVETRRAPRSTLAREPCASRIHCKYKDSIDRCRYNGRCMWKNVQKGG